MSEKTEQDTIKTFISYSWTSPDHEAWVLQLATELVDSGVDVILDKWDLKEGNDAFAFMERMVTDPDINKVIIISDKAYAEKADERSGGVGKETQIISSEVYEKVDQNKFVVVLKEKDDSGRPYLPTFYKSRIYIDLSSIDDYGKNFERLLRWLYDKPLYIKPSRGEVPSFISKPDESNLATGAKYKRAIDAIKNSKLYAHGAVNEYFETYIVELEKFRISDYEGEFDEVLIQNIEQFIPYKTEMLNIIIAIAQYDAPNEYQKILHRFFERLIPYTDRPEEIMSYNQTDFDNFKFIIHELFLSSVAIFLKYEKFQAASYLFRQRYFIKRHSDYGNNTSLSYKIFWLPVRSLSHRNDRLNLRRLSLHADLLNQRSGVLGLDFTYIMQADFVLYIRACLDSKRYKEENIWWWPVSLLYRARYGGIFEIFARAESKTYFDSLKCLFEIDSKNDLEQLMNEFDKGEIQTPRWQGERISPRNLFGFERLASLP